MDVLRFVLLLSGLTYLLTQSSLGMFVRAPLGNRNVWVAMLLYCPACSGFWFGFGLGALGLWPFEAVLFAPLEAAVGSTAMMALWAHYVPSDAWAAEQGWRNAKAKEEQ